MDPIEVAKNEYDTLVAAKAERDGAVTRADEAQEAAETLRTENASLKDQVTTLTKERDDAVEAKESAETKATEAEETANQEKMAKERIDALGDGFKAKLGDKTKANLERDAKAMSEEEWTARTEELAENLGVEIDAEKDGETETAGKGETLFNREEVAASRAGTPGSGDAASRNATGAVVGALFDQARK